MLQEQVSEYLGVTSFKRKYPGKEETLRRNTVHQYSCHFVKKTPFNTVALQECVTIIMHENTG